MKRRLGILGVGTAGITSAAGFTASMDNTWEVVSIYDPTIPGLDIGESTNSNFTQVLEVGCGFTIQENLDELDATLKFGTKFINWREKDWINPLIEGAVAIHFNTNKLREYVIPKLKKLWGDKYSTIEGTITSVTQSLENVSVVVDGESHIFDYVIDCRGFPESYEDYEHTTCTLINHAIVYDHKKPDLTLQSTEHIATENGWMFGIPLTTRKSYGYLYNDELTTKEAALADMSKIIGVPVKKLQVRDYTFKPYYAKQVLDGRILKNGNRALFFEPISATSVYMYVRTCRLFHEFLAGKITASEVNACWKQDIVDIENLICFYYHGGSTYNTEFWTKAKDNAVDFLKGSYTFYKHIKDLRDFKDKGIPYEYMGLQFGGLNWGKMDRYFEYYYIDKTNEFLFDMDRVNKDPNQLITNISTNVVLSEKFKEDGYLFIKSILDRPTVDLVSQYALFDHLQNYNPKTSGDGQIPGTHSKYADPLMESILIKLHPIMEQATGLKLYPTYSYYRVYKPGDELKKHKDRPSCEISTTVCFNFDYKSNKIEWPIYMDGNPCVMEPGDIVVYRGCDLAHWRDPFNAPEDSWHIQAFFHYVDANGPYPEFKWDRRPMLGHRDPPKPDAIPVTTGKNYITYIK
jgi:hypothetical protein